MKSFFHDLMQQATRLTRSGQLSAATQAIQRALHGPVPASPQATAPVPPPRQPKAAATAEASVVDDCVFELPPLDKPAAGEFMAGRHSHAALTRAYKLYIPPGAALQPRPLVVMLHGCTQDPDDFAAGTGMNTRACEQGFFVCYPAQAAAANPSRCWNWFKPNHQRRDRGEPALIASLTQALIQQHGIDARRVYIAGLSAGAAMAAIVAAAYPEIYAAVGVHSGLPCGGVSNAGDALQLMQRGVLPGRAGTGPTPAGGPVPTIVFHGDQDHTVHPRNGELMLASAISNASARAVPLPAQSYQGTCALGRRYTHTVHPGQDGKALAEHWLVHGAGHAWSGGHADGSFTDTKGPDATREMLRFFLQYALA